MLDEDGNPVNGNGAEAGESVNKESKEGHERASKEMFKPQEGKKEKKRKGTEQQVNLDDI